MGDIIGPTLEKSVLLVRVVFLIIVLIRVSVDASVQLWSACFA